ncbi:hypothetical protein [Amycolatopsis sp. NPDC059657]|uniref:LppU/SCO3897 family protein n=1 Tax=Amycolatopsis sp. NPDC059657 TaxID=3346899 RepID=UPI00366EDFAD
MSTPSSPMPENFGGNAAPGANADSVWHAPDPAQQAHGHFAPGVEGNPAPGMPRYPGHGGLSCRFCGSVPAEMATFRGHQGLLFIMRFLKLEGPFCRTCGVATHRAMTAKSLWQGWWGLASMVINPITMLINLPQRAKINKLAEPMPGAPGQPMNPGKPLFLRVAIIGLVVPALVVFAIVNAVRHDASYASVGDCVHNAHTMVSGVEDSHPDVSVIECSDPRADAKIVGKVKDSSAGASACRQFSDADGYYVEEQGRSKFTLCLHFLK